MRLRPTAGFRKKVRRLSEDQRAAVQDALRKLAEDRLDSGLRFKPIAGSGGLWEARVDRGMRIILFKCPDGTFDVVAVGSHNLLDQPKRRRSLKRPRRP